MTGRFEAATRPSERDARAGTAARRAGCADQPAAVFACAGALDGEAVFSDAAVFGAAAVLACVADAFGAATVLRRNGLRRRRSSEPTGASGGTPSSCSEPLVTDANTGPATVPP